MTKLSTLALASLLFLSDESPHARLRTICDTIASAPSATFEVKLPNLSEVKTRTKPDGSTVGVGGRGGKPQKLVIRHETGKPEHLRLDDAEIFRFPDGVLVGRLGEGRWSVVPLPAEPARSSFPFKAGDGSTALDRLAHVARSMPVPSALFGRVRDEIREATASENDGVVVLEAWLNGHRPTKELLAKEAGPSDVEQSTRVVARVRQDGGVESIEVERQVFREVRHNTLLGAERNTFVPSALGATHVDVPPEVAALAAG